MGSIDFADAALAASDKFNISTMKMEMRRGFIVGRHRLTTVRAPLAQLWQYVYLIVMLETPVGSTD